MAADIVQPRSTVLFSDDDLVDESDRSSQSGGLTSTGNGTLPKDGHLQINETYAQRYKDKKTREELRKLQDKYGHSANSTESHSRKGTGEAQEDDQSTSSSDEDEDEDEDGILALGVLDEQVHDTLEAIRNKDPRVYDVNSKFFNEPDDEPDDATDRTGKQEKPLYLSDYHRNNILEGRVGGDDDEHISLPKTYQEQQAELKDSIVKEMHATANDVASEVGSDYEPEGTFLVKKAVVSRGQTETTGINRKGTTLDVDSADQDPEAYLSRFMSAKGWVTRGDSTLQPFESDDDEQERQAETFEEAYNLRFEDPKTSNEKLLSHARDAATKYSVRKEDMNPRKRKRDTERERRIAEKEIRSEEKTRLRKLKVADLQAKLEKIKDAAGWTDANLPEEEWSTLLGDAWDGEQWEKEMMKRFGDAYYAMQEEEGDDDDQTPKKQKISKPKWKEDIDIGDLIPEFEGDNQVQNEPFQSPDTNAAIGDRRRRKASKKGEQERRKDVRSDRRKIEQLVDEQLGIDETLTNFGKKHAGTFHYRDTSPLSHGLTVNDILMADDSQLNQFAGLKKLATFREPDKKKKDKKLLGKKQRIKQWRKETFGDENGPTKTLAEMFPGQQSEDGGKSTEPFEGGDIKEGKRSKKGLRKSDKSRVAASNIEA